MMRLDSLKSRGGLTVADMLTAMDNAKALGSGLSVLIEVVCSEFLLPNCEDCRETVRLNY